MPDMMLNVTIDASVIAADSICSADELHKYVDTLLGWSEILDEPWVAIHISDRAAEALLADDLYPLHGQLRSLFKNYGVVEYDVNTVAKVVNKLLTLTPSFQEYHRVKEILAEPINTDPDIIERTRHDGLRSDLARCIVFIAILRKHTRQPLAGHSLILRSAPNPIVNVRAQIHAIEHERDDLPELPEPPEFFDGEVVICDDFKGLVECLDDGAILAGTSSVLGIALAIKIALFKYDLRKGGDPDWDRAEVPRIGHGFLESCRRCCRDRGEDLPPKILRAVAETMRNQNMASVHPLRVGKGGNDPQRMRGDDKARRRDIDYEFHLHYWECAAGDIELGSVVHHNDFSIPE